MKIDVGRVVQRARCAQFIVRLGAVLIVALVPLSACSRSEPNVASRDPDVPYEPSPPHVVEAMLELAEVGRDDVVFDLGCGDGRIVIAAVKQFGATGTCIDIDPQRIREARGNAEREGVAERITFLTQDLFDADLGSASVVMLFLWPSVNLKLRPKLEQELKSGSRVVSHMHDMGDWAPDAQVTVQVDGQMRTIHRWVLR